MEYLRSGGQQEQVALSEIRNFSHFFAILQFPAIFPQLLFAYPPRMLVGALCVPCAELLLFEASHALAPQFFHNFPQFFVIGFDASRPQFNPPPPAALHHKGAIKTSTGA